MAAVSSTNNNELQSDKRPKAMTPANQGKLKLAKSGIEQRDWEKRCIYRVPSALKGSPGDYSYYDANCRPKLISIGPYHNGDRRLEAMQFYKYRMLHHVLEISKTDISTMVNAVKNLEREARACYEDLPKKFSSEVFAEMLLLDGCFIIGYAYRCAEDNDPVIYKSHNNCEIWKDMLLLENQIPLFVLDQLHRVIQANWPYEVQVVDRLFRKLQPRWVIGCYPTSKEGEMPELSSLLLRDIDGNVQSCIEILWHNLMYDSTTKEYTHKRTQEGTIKDWERIVDLERHAIPSVGMLREAGVVLKRKTTTPFWDIEFNAGVLKIPQIFISDGSESMFVNLMAFELCHVDEKKYKVTPYVLFMDSLVNSAFDVAQLRSRGIIVYTGGCDEEVAALFNRLGKRVLIPFNQFGGLSQQINNYCNKKCNRWRANLKHNYFKNPWTIISVIAAAFLMLLTILQTCYSTLQYYQKS